MSRITSPLPGTATLCTVKIAEPILSTPVSASTSVIDATTLDPSNTSSLWNVKCIHPWPTTTRELTLRIMFHPYWLLLEGFSDLLVAAVVVAVALTRRNVEDLPISIMFRAVDSSIFLSAASWFISASTILLML